MTQPLGTLSGNFFQNVPLLVQSQQGDGAMRHRGVLYGSIPGKQLLIGGVKTAVFSSGDNVIVRLLMEGSIVGFKTKIEETIGGLDPLYLVGFPEEVERVDLRKSERMPVFIPVEITFSTDDDKNIHFVHGAFINISEGGCRVTARRILRDISRCEVSFTLPGSPHKHLLACRLVSGGKKNSSFSNLGLAFQRDGKSAAILGTVREWIAANLQLASC